MVWIAAPMPAAAQTTTPSATIADPHPAPQTTTPSSIEEVTVTGNRVEAGGGEMVAETSAEVAETLSRSFIEQQTPTANAVTLIATLPSVNVSTADAFGLNSGGNVQIHGLSTNDLGWILDGMPVYSQGAGFANEMISAQDLETISVAPGSSNLADPTISSAAGTIYLSMRDPSKTPGGFFESAYGSDALNREFLRLDTGEIDDTGIRAFVSFTHAKANNWRGAGDTDQKHLDFKIVKEWDNGSRIALESSANQQYYGYYYYPTASQFANYNATYSQFNTNGKYSGIADTSFYLLNQQNPFNFGSLQAPSHFVITDHFSFDDTPYVWYGLGGGTGGSDLAQGSTYQGTQPVSVDLTDGGKIPLTNGQVLANTGFFEQTVQAGNVMKVIATFGNNTAVAGWWYENNNQGEEDPVGKVNQATGVPYPASFGGSLDGDSIYRLANGYAYYSNHSNQRYEDHTLFAGDTLSLLDDKLTINAGIKVAIIDEFVTNYLPGAHYRNGLDDTEPLPQAGIRYQIDPNSQVFVHAERDYRLPFTFSLVGYYNLTNGSIESNFGSPKPETATKEEVGYRYQSDGLLADISFFNIDLNNRLLTLNTYNNGSPLAQTVNAGGQTSRGVDFQAASQPLYGYFSPYVSFEYLDAKITTNTAAIDVNGNPDYLPTKGKTQVQSPAVQGSLGLAFKDGPFAADVRLRFVGSQYSTLVDDEKQSGYVTDDVSFSYQFPDMGHNVQPKLQLNLFNLTNSLFRDGVYQFQYNAQNTIGTNGHVIPASGSPTYYVEPNFAAVISFSTPF